MVVDNKKKKGLIGLSLQLPKINGNKTGKNKDFLSKLMSFVPNKRFLLAMVFGIVFSLLGFLFRVYNTEGMTGIINLPMSLIKGRQQTSIPAKVDPLQKPLVYEQYVSLAKHRRWDIKDPIIKLHKDATAFCQVAIDSYFERGVGEKASYESALKAEITMLIGILYRSKHRKIDISYIMYDVIESINQCYFQFSRKTLQSNATWISRKQSEELLASKIYYPVQELLKLKFQISTEAYNDKSKKPHLTLDFDKASGRSERNILALTTYYRMHRVLRPLLSLNISTDGALFEAVANRDEYAAALLLQFPLVISPITSSSSSIDAMAFEFCQHIKHTILIDIFDKAYRYWNITHNRPVSMPLSFLSSYDTLSSVDILRRPSTKESHDKLGDGGYPATSVTMPAMEVRNRNHTVTTVIGDCHLPHIRLSSLSAEDFRMNHVWTATPAVLIDDIGLVEGEFQRSTKWRYDHLLQAYSSQMVTLSHVPYSSLFSMQEQIVSLSEYLISLHNVTNQMATTIKSKGRRFKLVSDKLSKMFHHNSKPPPDVDKDTLSFRFDQDNMKTILDNLPDYLFTRSIDLDRSHSKLYDDLESMLAKAKAFYAILSLLRSELSSESKDDKVRATSNQTILQFYLGSMMSGAPWHSHGSALNVLLYGRKQWTLLPPSKDIYTKMHPLRFQTAAYDGRLNDSMLEAYMMSACQVEQHEGEIIYVPRHWSHQVLNTAASIGFAVEIQDYY